jgi:selenocysteine lyase/cysteine desulfurase
MNHAGLSPVSRRVASAIHAFADEAVVVDRPTYLRWEARVEAVRATIARLIGGRAHELAFVRNTAEGLSLIAAGLSWAAGDNVVGIADEYPSNVYPWFGLRRLGVETRLVPRPALRFGVDEVAALCDGRTRVVAVSAVDWQSGFRADLGALGAFCRERGILFVVDGIQAVGGVRIDVERCAIDALAAGGHKWLLAPEGCGLLYVSDRVIDRLHPVVLGWKSVTDPDRYLPYHFDLRADAGKFEAGTAQHLSIHALGAAIDLLLEVGVDAIEARVLELTDRLAHGLTELGAQILSPRSPAERSAILTFTLGDDIPALHRAFTEAGIVCRQRLGGVRLAPHFYNDGTDVARVLAAAHEFAG